MIDKCDKNCDHEKDRKGQDSIPPWPAGPWDNEPNRVEFKTKAGLQGLIHRNRWGVWCGYVGVTKDHPLHGVSYNDYEHPLFEFMPDEVHGGLTYAGECGGAICHVPEPGEPDELFWFGFDCGHGRDITPGMENFNRKFLDGHPEFKDLPKDTYRDQAYVTAEVERLAEQLARVA